MERKKGEAMNDTPLSKEAVVLKLLAEGDTMICLDARCQDVRVPPQHANNHDLRLILNLNFPRPIEVTADGISAGLSFGGRRFACFVPMAALWAAFNPQTMQGMMWPESMPAEVVQEFTRRQTNRQQVPAAPPTSPAPADVGSASTQPATATSAAEPPPLRQRGHLRVIK
jgi:stringent starvation protein B